MSSRLSVEVKTRVFLDCLRASASRGHIFHIVCLLDCLSTFSFICFSSSFILQTLYIPSHISTSAIGNLHKIWLLSFKDSQNYTF